MENKTYATESFSKYADAVAFATAHHGAIEGPFMDENLNTHYIVFYIVG